MSRLTGTILINLTGRNTPLQSRRRTYVAPKLILALCCFAPVGNHSSPDSIFAQLVAVGPNFSVRAAVNYFTQQIRITSPLPRPKT